MPPKIRNKKVENQPTRSHGRPRKVFVSRGRHAAKVLRERLLDLSTPPPNPAASGPESVSGGLPFSSDQAREVELADEDYGDIQSPVKHFQATKTLCGLEAKNNNRNVQRDERGVIQTTASTIAQQKFPGN
ncbi:hypothetical protein B0H19DRAFT_1085968 [Mycena capillaripes]|nr:hypothetical protein B0H19DRAFT_1085968 [Mycena capillaripes]